jgi:hypothetical protein
MRRSARRLFTLCQTVSLVLLVLVCAVWGRSRFVRDVISGGNGMDYWEFSSDASRLRLALYHRMRVSPPAWPEPLRWQRMGAGYNFPWAGPHERYEILGMGWDVPGNYNNEIISRDWWVTYWIPAALAAVLPLTGFQRRVPQWHQHRRRRSGLCPACGYDLRATPGRCPECGTAAATAATAEAPATAPAG